MNQTTRYKQNVAEKPCYVVQQLESAVVQHLSVLLFPERFIVLVRLRVN